MKYNADDIAWFLAKEGAKGSYYTRPGVKVNYEWVDGTAKAEMVIEDWLWKEVLDYCKLCRENEVVIAATVPDGINGLTFMFWPFLDVVFQSRGIDYNEILREKDHAGLKKVYEIVETEFPAFKMTNRKLWQRPVPKAVARP